MQNYSALIMSNSGYTRELIEAETPAAALEMAKELFESNMLGDLESYDDHLLTSITIDEAPTRGEDGAYDLATWIAPEELRERAAAEMLATLEAVWTRWDKEDTIDAPHLAHSIESAIRLAKGEPVRTFSEFCMEYTPDQVQA